MSEHYLSHVAGPAVLEAQQRYFGVAHHAMGADKTAARDLLGAEELQFISERDSFYLASVSETGWPYVQHRGGPRGFLKTLDSGRLAFADVRGNRQMITTGNVAVSDRVSLFLMDYPKRERLKILGHARVFDARERRDLVEAVTPPEWVKIVERVTVIDVVAFDWNCPKYITPRYTAAEVETVTAPLRRRIQELETELNQLRSANRAASSSS